MASVKKYIPKTKEEVLSELKKIDKFDLLKVNKREKNDNPNKVLINSFEEINQFVDECNRLPEEKNGGMREFQLFQRYMGIMLDDNKIEILKPYDRHGILVKAEQETKSPGSKKPIEEVTKTKIGLEDKFGLLKSLGSSIFKIKNVSRIEDKKTTMPEEVAKRKKCTEFHLFEPLFLKCQKDIASGDRKVVPFRNEQDIKAGAFFIYGGLKCYVAEVGEKTNEKGKINARLRLIFDNGVESNMLLRSLAAELYKDGRRILEPRLADSKNEISDEDTTGYIYILSSLNTSEEIRNIPNLYKIGFSTTSVEQRIKNAKNEATYLMADVKIVASYKVTGINATYFENLIHKIFDHVQVQIDVIDLEGKLKKPKEWFSVPYDVIEDALRLIESREIVGYVYDSEAEKLLKL